MPRTPQHHATASQRVDLPGPPRRPQCAEAAFPPHGSAPRPCSGAGIRRGRSRPRPRPAPPANMRRSAPMHHFLGCRRPQRNELTALRPHGSRDHSDHLGGAVISPARVAEVHHQPNWRHSGVDQLLHAAQVRRLVPGPCGQRAWRGERNGPSGTGADQQRPAASRVRRRRSRALWQGFRTSHRRRTRAAECLGHRTPGRGMALCPPACFRIPAVPLRALRARARSSSGRRARGG